jgi:hypothetical protein
VVSYYANGAQQQHFTPNKSISSSSNEWVNSTNSAQKQQQHPSQSAHQIQVKQAIDFNAFQQVIPPPPMSPMQQPQLISPYQIYPNHPYYCYNYPAAANLGAPTAPSSQQPALVNSLAGTIASVSSVLNNSNSGNGSSSKTNISTSASSSSSSNSGANGNNGKSMPIHQQQQQLNWMNNNGPNTGNNQQQPIYTQPQQHLPLNYDSSIGILDNGATTGDTSVPSQQLATTPTTVDQLDDLIRQNLAIQQQPPPQNGGGYYYTINPAAYHQQPPQAMPPSQSIPLPQPPYYYYYTTSPNGSAPQPYHQQPSIMPLPPSLQQPPQYQQQHQQQQQQHFTTSMQTPFIIHPTPIDMYSSQQQPPLLKLPMPSYVQYSNTPQPPSQVIMQQQQQNAPPQYSTQASIQQPSSFKQNTRGISTNKVPLSQPPQPQRQTTSYTRISNTSLSSSSSNTNAKPISKQSTGNTTTTASTINNKSSSATNTTSID